MEPLKSWLFGRALTKDATRCYGQANLFTLDQLYADPQVEWSNEGVLQVSLLQYSQYHGAIEIQLCMEGPITEFSSELHRIMSRFDVGNAGIVIIQCSLYLAEYAFVPEIICLRVDELSYVSMVLDEADPMHPSEFFGSTHPSATFALSRALENLIELGHVVFGFEYWKSLASET